MEIHPWTKYEIARLRNEERLLRAREAMRALEVREAVSSETAAGGSPSRASWRERIRRRGVATDQEPAGSGA